VQGYAPEGR